MVRAITIRRFYDTNSGSNFSMSYRRLLTNEMRGSLSGVAPNLPRSQWLATTVEKLATAPGRRRHHPWMAVATATRPTASSANYVARRRPVNYALPREKSMPRPHFTIRHAPPPRRGRLLPNAPNPGRGPSRGQKERPRHAPTRAPRATGAPQSRLTEGPRKEEIADRAALPRSNSA